MYSPEGEYMAKSCITDQQYRLYMTHRQNGLSQSTAAAKAGFSEKTARRLRKAGMQPSARRRRHTYRSREDPFTDVWESELGISKAGSSTRRRPTANWRSP